MTNLTTFEEQVQNFTTGFVSVISALAPLALVLVIIGIAMTNALVEYKYQLAVFGSLAYIPAVLVAGFRFGSGFGGVALVKQGRYLTGIFFVIISLVLTFYTFTHADVIAAQIAPDAVASAKFTVSFILWSGFVGEIMLMSFLGIKATAERQAQSSTSWTPAADAKQNGHVKQNGQIKSST